MYRDARGVPQDDIAAYAWFLLAVWHGSDPIPGGRADGARNLEELSKRMTSDQVVEAKRLSRALFERIR